MNATTLTWQAMAATLFLTLLPVLRAWVLTKLTPQRVGVVNDLARVAVRASEQLGVDLGANGAEKLNYASDVVVAGAKRLGIRLKPDEVLAFIHAALREMKQVDATAFAG